jgi:hypothetical protein
MSIVEREGGDADVQAGAAELADGADGEIGLTDVDSVSAAEEGNIGPVVNEDSCGGALREAHELGGAVEEFLPFEGLFAKLEDVCPAVDGALGDLQPGKGAEGLGEDHAEAGLRDGAGAEGENQVLLE